MHQKFMDEAIKEAEISLSEGGIPIGAELVFIENPEVKEVVCDDRKVKYNNEFTSLPAVARLFKGYKNIAGPSFFTYNGRLVTEIAHETQWKDFQ